MSMKLSKINETSSLLKLHFCFPFFSPFYKALLLLLKKSFFDSLKKNNFFFFINSKHAFRFSHSYHFDWFWIALFLYIKRYLFRNLTETLEFFLIQNFHSRIFTKKSLSTEAQFFLISKQHVKSLKITFFFFVISDLFFDKIYKSVNVS